MHHVKRLKLKVKLGCLSIVKSTLEYDDDVELIKIEIPVNLRRIQILSSFSCLSSPENSCYLCRRCLFKGNIRITASQLVADVVKLPHFSIFPARKDVECNIQKAYYGIATRIRCDSRNRKCRTQSEIPNTVRVRVN